MTQPNLSDQRRAEEALRASETRFQRLFEENLAGVFQATVDGILLNANDSYAGIFGYTRDELLTLRLSDLYPGALPEFAEMQERLRRDGFVRNFELRGRRKDGATISTLENVTLVNTPDEAFPYMQGTVIDVTERVETRDQLIAAEAKFRHLVEQTLTGVFIVQDGRLRYVNPKFVEMVGFTEAELLAMESITDLVAPEDRESIEDLIRQRRERVYPPVYSFRILRKDGERIDVEVMGAQTTLDGRKAVIGTLLDVTRRRQAEEERALLQQSLARAAQEWRSTFDTIRSPIVVCDVDGSISRLNFAARELAGAPYEALLGKPLEATATGEPWKKALELVRDALSGTISDATVTDPMTNRTWGVSVNLSNAERPDDRRVVLGFQELTGIVKLQESLRRSERMSEMGQLVAGVAHEVRNPLFGMSATLDAFEARAKEYPQFDRYLKPLREQLRRLNGLMGDLLEYGKSSAGERFASAPVDVVILQAVMMCRESALAAKVEIKTTFGDHHCLVSMDSARLVQVFRNLVENAIQHSPPESTVTVATRCACTPQERRIECRIDDRGQGFKREDLSRLFEPFFTRRRGGTGLGLSIVARIVDEHGGSVVADNRPDGGGSMAVYLPCA